MNAGEELRQWEIRQLERAFLLGPSTHTLRVLAIDELSTMDRARWTALAEYRRRVAERFREHVRERFKDRGDYV